MVPGKNDKQWKEKTWEDVVSVDVRYKDRDKTIPEINIWRRTSSGKVRTIDPDEFPSYFYIPITYIDRIDIMEKSLMPISLEYPDYKAFDGETVVKLVFGPISKAQFASARAFFPKTYEADVKYRLKYHLDNNIKFTPNRRICFFDIETDMSVDIENTPAPITAISAYDTETKEMMTLLLDRDIKTRFEDIRKDHEMVITFKKETDLLQAFINYIKVHNPDILCAFNLYEFDYPYLINRMKTLDIKYRDLSEINDVYVIVDKQDQEATRCRCGGRELLDYFVIIKKLYDEDKPDTFKLDDVAEMITGHVKTKHEYKNLRELYENNKELFVEYNQQDVQLLVEIEEKTGFILKYLTSLQQLVPMPLESLKDNSNVVDFYMLNSFNKKVIFPSKKIVDASERREKTKGKAKFKGALTGKFVMNEDTGEITSTDPDKRMYDFVGVFDYSGMYTNIIRTFDISPDMKCMPGEPDSISIAKTAFLQYKVGILPSLIEKIATLRSKFQKILETLPPTHQDYPMYNAMQAGIKRLGNSVYGVTGYKNFRLYDVEVAEAITSIGQELIKLTFKTLKKLGYDVIYGDTDSCFFITKSKTKEEFDVEVKYLEEYINNIIGEHIKKRGVEINYLHMDFEKRFSKVIFFGVKKRYIGKADYWKGKWLSKPKIIIKGYDLVRRELAKKIKVIIKDIIFMFLDGVDKEIIKKYYKDSIVSIMNTPIVDLAWKKGLGKNMDDYDKVLPQHIKACICAKQHLNIDFKKNDSPKIMYVKDLPYEYEGKLLYSDVIAFEKDTELPKHIINKIDYKRFIESFVNNKLDDFLGVEGMNMEYVLSRQVCNLNNFESIRKEILGEVVEE